MSYYPAASQSTVFVTMVDDGEGSSTGGTSGGSVAGNCFGVVVISASYTNPGLILNLAGSGSGQSFFRTLRLIASNGSVTATLNSSAATYNSGANQWAWSSGSIGPDSYTFQFFR